MAGGSEYIAVSMAEVQVGCVVRITSRLDLHCIMISGILIVS